MRKGAYLYVDKTDMISQILMDNAEVHLYTRPRRFGKSLNLSMLDAFFNIEYKDDNPHFEGLKVSNDEGCLKHMNAYPVVFFDFKTLRVGSKYTFESDLKDEFSRLYRRYGYLLESDNLDAQEKRYISEVMGGIVEPIRLRKALLNLTECLHKHHGIPVIVLLDEYDNPIHNSYGKPHFDEILSYMRDMLSFALKNKESHLKFGVITGVMQIAKESIFSGLNNITVNNILSRDFDEVFGFTSDEVMSILSEYGYQDSFDVAREWYDGYRFGNSEIYNPWSVLEFVSNRCTPKSYWAGTSGNDILEDLITGAISGLQDDLDILAEGGPIPHEIQESITLQDLGSEEGDVYSVMVMSGYLTTGVNKYGTPTVSIPNQEIARELGKMILRRRNMSAPTHVGALGDSLIKGDLDAIGHSLYELFASSAGTAMLNDEHSYQAYITGLLMHLFGRYEVKADFEEGNGRYDIRMKRRYGAFPNVVIELKRTPTDASDAKAESDAGQALQQIKDRDYTHGMTGRTLLYGISFRNKMPLIVFEEITL